LFFAMETTQLLGCHTHQSGTAIRTKAAPGQYEQAQTQAANAIAGLGLLARILCLDMKTALSSLTSIHRDSTHRSWRRWPTGLPAILQHRVLPLPPRKRQQVGVLRRNRQPLTTPDNQVRPCQPPPDRAQVDDGSFDVPTNWKPGKATPTQAFYQRPNKYNDIQLFAFEQVPMQGDLNASFPAAVRRMFPGIPPKLQHIYPVLTRTNCERCMAATEAG
jgi:hypothetical protein